MALQVKVNPKELYNDDWIEYLKEKVREDLQLIFYVIDEFDHQSLDITQFVEIPSCIIEIAFKISYYFNAKPQVKYMAIQLYEKFVCCLFQQFYNIGSVRDTVQNLWFLASMRVLKEKKLHIMSCFQLAYKMESPSSVLSIAKVTRILYLITGRVYSEEMILDAERYIHKIVDFKVPRYSPFHCVEAVLIATGLMNIPDMFKFCESLLDIAYLKRDELYQDFRSYSINTITKPETIKKLIFLRTNIFFISAAVVTCALFSCNDLKDTYALGKLIELSNAKKNWVFKMSSLLYLAKLKEKCANII